MTPQPRVSGRIEDQQSIAEHIARIPDEYLPCREGRRHSYSFVPEQQMRFEARPDGYDYFVNDCTSCGVAYQEEKWLIRERDGRVVKMQLIDRTTKYHRIDDERQPEYLLPKGSGYVSARDFRETRIASAFEGKSIRRSGRRSQGATG